MENKVVKFILSIVIASVLSGCGYHLRGSKGINTNASLQQISLTTLNPYDDVSREVKQALQLNGNKIVDANDTIPQIKIISSRFDVGSTAKDQAYQTVQSLYKFTINYQVIFPNQLPQNYSSIVTEYSLTPTANNPNAGKALTTYLNQELMEEAVSKMISQINRIQFIS